VSTQGGREVSSGDKIQGPEGQLVHELHERMRQKAGLLAKG
jgi:hypothetical protein